MNEKKETTVICGLYNSTLGSNVTINGAPYRVIKLELTSSPRDPIQIAITLERY